VHLKLESTAPCELTLSWGDETAAATAPAGTEWIQVVISPTQAPVTRVNIALPEECRLLTYALE